MTPLRNLNPIIEVQTPAVKHSGDLALLQPRSAMELGTYPLQTGLIWVINQLRERKLIIDSAADGRISHGIGPDSLRPFATVIVGGSVALHL